MHTRDWMLPVIARLPDCREMTRDATIWLARIHTVCNSFVDHPTAIVKSLVPGQSRVCATRSAFFSFHYSIKSSLASGLRRALG